MAKLLLRLLVISGVLGLVLALPVAGVAVAGLELGPYLVFPPRPAPSGMESWSWFGAGVILALILAPISPFLIWTYRARGIVRWWPIAAHPWPAWAAPSFLGLGFFWLIAWTRFPCFAGFQKYTFTPLWLSFILCLNARLVRASGSCPLTHHPAWYAALFPLSALLWWMFEFLNRFAGNWSYENVEQFSAGEYALHCTLAFSTVLPAFVAMQELVLSCPGFKSAFSGHAPAFKIPFRPLAFFAVLFSALGLFVLPAHPREFYPMLWLAPGLLFIGLQALVGEEHVLSASPRGDFSGLWSAALAALACGFFWEMWNLHSLARWVYHVPWVQRFRVFEMPLLGYGGYLPFGVECAAFAGWLSVLMGVPAPGTKNSGDDPTVTSPS